MLDNLIYDSETKEYYFKDDKEYLKEYKNHIKNLKDKDKYKYHLEVLPHPYFGNIENPNVLFLALNPSFDEYDLKDKTKFEEKYPKIDKEALKKYIKYLSKVDFINNNIGNLYATSSVIWWDKVIGVRDKSIKKKVIECGYINLSPYHSNEYYEGTFNNFIYQKWVADKLLYLKNTHDLELIIVVWGKGIWDRFINSHFLQYDNLDSLFENKCIITLNKNIKIEKYNDKYDKYVRNINKLTDLINSDKYYNIYTNESLEKFQEIFKFLKSKYKK